MHIYIHIFYVDKYVHVYAYKSTREQLINYFILVYYIMFGFMFTLFVN